MRTADFDYNLPPELIAQHPAVGRDQSRLLVLDRKTGGISHKTFRDLAQFLRLNDVLVLNNSRVIRARLRGTNARTGGNFEILLLKENSTNDWWVMLRPGKRARPGTEIVFHQRVGQKRDLAATVIDTNEEGHRRLVFAGVENVLNSLSDYGEIPLPPYIARAPGDELPEDLARYQTVYANPPGSVAAPTAGLHFTTGILDQLRSNGVEIAFLTLHIGLGTFAPVKADTIAQHTMHEERYELGNETVSAILRAKRTGGRVVAIGTTCVRVLESVARENEGRLVPGPGRTKIFIHPPYDFKVVDVLLTNFHLPKSTLLMLISAFAAPGSGRGRDLALGAYAEAVREHYRFFSFGDAMLIL